MKRIVQINATCGSGSTGKICVAVSELLHDQGIENYIFHASGESKYPLGKRYMNSREVKIQAMKSRIFGNYGMQSKAATRRLLQHLDAVGPDIVHLHNLHGHNVHLGLLFGYLKEKKIKVFWTFHDCWAFTGYCPHYDMVGCDKWKTQCRQCPQRKSYSWFFDRSKYLFEKKKELFSGLDLTIITPSHWLAEQVKQSFLQDYAVKVIHNGIDLSVFQPRNSDFRQKHHLENKYIVLGVAFGWGPRKGLDVFVELAKRLDERFQIVLVGTNDKVDQQLPKNIISIHRTNNQLELAEIYTAADVFVNPTREEVLGLTNLEALACGVPVITFRTGGSVECIDATCGEVVNKNDVDTLAERIVTICQDQPYSSEDCFHKAREFDKETKFMENIELYRSFDQCDHSRIQG